MMGVAFFSAAFWVTNFQANFCSSCLFFLSFTARQAHKRICLCTYTCVQTHFTAHLLRRTGHLGCSGSDSKHTLQVRTSACADTVKGWFLKLSLSRSVEQLGFLFHKTPHTGYELGLMQSRVLIRPAYVSCQKSGRSDSDTAYVEKQAGFS